MTGFSTCARTFVISLTLLVSACGGGSSDSTYPDDDAVPQELMGTWLSACDVDVQSGFTFLNSTVRVFNRFYDAAGSCSGSYQEVVLGRADVEVGDSLTTTQGMTARELDLTYTFVEYFGEDPRPEDPRVGDVFLTIYRITNNTLYIGDGDGSSRPDTLELSEGYSKASGG